MTWLMRRRPEVFVAPVLTETQQLRAENAVLRRERDTAIQEAEQLRAQVGLLELRTRRVPVPPIRVGRA